MKTCSRCGNTKDDNEFYKNARLKDGLHSWCKACCKAARRLRWEDPAVKVRNAVAVRKWREGHPEKVKEIKHAKAKAGYLNPKMKQWWPD